MTEGDGSNNTRTVAVPCPFVKRQVECVGAAFLRYFNIKCHGEDAAFETSEAKEKAEEVVFDDDVEYLRSLDPKEWKQQDHYAVLGMKRLRYRATDDDIKRAYRQKVLRHHPDKRKAQGEDVRSDDDYFTCITKAYEILGTPAKRRSYDSVDPEFDDSVPTQGDVKKDGFYETFAKVFARNARWSEKRNVPPLGDERSPREAVERFYAFWYEFDSWREFSYLDEEEKERGQDREERRWIEKQNKAARAKLKKEEMARLRGLVDLAYAADPRVLRFKQEDKDRKLAAKRARQDAVQAKKAEEERLVKEALQAKREAEEAERARVEAARAERDLAKKLLRRERRALRDCCRARDYFTGGDGDGEGEGDEGEAVRHLAGVERLCETLGASELQELVRRLERGGRDAFLQALADCDRRLERERRAPPAPTPGPEPGEPAAAAPPPPPRALEWTADATQLLVKAVNLFPAGTARRWDVVAEFLNRHAAFPDERRFGAKEVLNRAKGLQSSDFSRGGLRRAADEEAFDRFEKEKRRGAGAVDDDGISRSDGPVNGAAEPELNGAAGPGRAWTRTEQELLEQAIKTFPASTPERWERIADCIPNRSKKDCMRRYKELVELVKAKKQAANLAK